MRFKGNIINIAKIFGGMVCNYQILPFLSALLNYINNSFKLRLITAAEFFSSLGTDFSVDPDLAFLNNDFCMAARLNGIAHLEESIKSYKIRINFL